MNDLVTGGSLIVWPDPWWGGSRTVPYSELPVAGEGVVVAAVLREAIRAGEESEGREFAGFGGSLCMNCGSRRPEVGENGGWCDRCRGPL